SFPENVAIRARSSTNNEDLEGFNGAGLYESYTHHKTEGHFAKTAKQVWAGLWTYRAFEERDFWRIDHMTAAMGILVHQSFQNEIANGVGVTKNIYLPGPGWEGHYVNVQTGENLVTNPEPGSIPEEYIIADLGFESNYEIQYIRNSNQIEPGQRILTRTQALRLKNYMDIVHSHFKALYKGNSNFAMEIEFKLIESGKFIIKQARPWIE
ncbi:MAG: PEP/pyruvate-binding domain-containing protein, partial [Verrucomicrobiales bacterium]|nr:PEP/pyruvate-binding domain-containing protein [Verrucomicrobiales bacterium]